MFVQCSSCSQSSHSPPQLIHITVPYLYSLISPFQCPSVVCCSCVNVRVVFRVVASSVDPCCFTAPEHRSPSTSTQHRALDHRSPCVSESERFPLCGPSGADCCTRDRDRTLRGTFIPDLSYSVFEFLINIVHPQLFPVFCHDMCKANC